MNILIQSTFFIIFAQCLYPTTVNLNQTVVESNLNKTRWPAACVTGYHQARTIWTKNKGPNVTFCVESDGKIIDDLNFSSAVSYLLSRLGEYIKTRLELVEMNKKCDVRVYFQNFNGTGVGIYSRSSNQIYIHNSTTLSIMDIVSLKISDRRVLFFLSSTR